MFKDPVDLGFEMLRTGVVPPPSREPIFGDIAYPVALDVSDGFAAVLSPF